MRAMAVTRYGEPLEEIERPEPTLTPGHALLEVLACGVCFSDVKTVRGHMPYSDDLELPHVPGHEVVGRVVRTEPPELVAAGTVATVFHYWPCGRCASCRRGDETLCSNLVAWMGFTHPGGFQERLSVPVDRLVPVPPSIDPVHAAPLSCAMGTAYRSVVTRGETRVGSRVAIIGLGGVGIHAAQIAIAAGATTVGFDIHVGSLRAALELGIDARSSDDDAAIADTIAASDGEGLDVVVDTVGRQETLGLARGLVRAGGRVVGVGYAPATTLEVPTPEFVLDEVSYVGSRYAHRDDLARAVALVARGLVTPVVGLVKPLSDVNEVFDELLAGNVVGRAALVVGGAGD